MSNMALVLVYYIFDKGYEINSLKATDTFSITLTKLFGVDAGSLKKNIFLVLGAPSTTKQLSERRKTELRNTFNEVYDFLESVQYQEGIIILKNLELRFFR